MTEQTHEAAIREVWNLFKEADRQMAKTDWQMAETGRRMAETDRQMAETNREISRLYGLFTSQWGKLIEALVKPDSIRLFQERGIQVSQVYQRAKSQRNGRSMEIDLILENSTEVVLLEVKSTLKVQDVRDFLKKLDQLLLFFPRYRGYRVYGGVAGLEIAEGADRFAYRRGLFVLGVMGEGVMGIMNDAAFRPRDFGREVEAVPPG